MSYHNYFLAYGILKSKNNCDYVKKLKLLSTAITSIKLNGFALFIHKNDKHTPTIYKTDNVNDYVVCDVYCYSEQNHDELSLLIDDILTKNGSTGKTFEKINIEIHISNKIIFVNTFTTNNISDYEYVKYHDYFDYLKNELNLFI